MSMKQFDKDKAAAVLAKLKLGDLSRRFADHWLSMVSSDGRLNEPDFYRLTDEDLKVRLIVFEITPHSVRIKRAGVQIVEAVGINLVGEDYLTMAPPAQRATRLMRFSEIAEGAVSRHQRWVVNTAGKVHFVNELAVPCGLSEDGFPMVATYVDTDTKGSVGHIPPKKGAMNIAPVFETYAIT